MIEDTAAGNAGYSRNTRHSGPLVLALMALTISFGYQSYAQTEGAQSSIEKTFDYSVMSVLDGKSFSGELSGPGIGPGRTDVVLFKDGMFVSEECQRRCGYTDGPYWIRSDGAGVKFLAETPCLEADATIVWRGTVIGDELEGTFTWTSERWYWTVVKEFQFSGKLVKSGISAQD